MDFTTASSRVASFVDDLRSTDWQKRIGSWTLTLVAVTIVWWFLRRVWYTANAVRGEREMPMMVPETVSAVFFPIELGLVAIFACWGYLCALGVWRLVGRRYRVDSLSRRLAAVFIAGSVGLAALLFVLGTILQIAEGNPPAAVVSDGVGEITEWLPEWLVYLLIPTVATSLVASWRRGEFELTARRRQVLAVAAVAIIVAPGILGAAGVGAASDPPPRPDGGFDASDLNDGWRGPSHAEVMNYTNLSTGAYQPATTVLSCGRVDESVYTPPEWMDHHAAATQINISSPDDADRVYLEVAPYRNESGIVHGRYAARIVPVQEGNWTVLDSEIYNVEESGETASGSFVNGDMAYESDTGQLAMENVEALTLELELVNPDGEIVRVRYRLCQPTGDS